MTPRGTPRAQSPPPVGELASAPHDADEKGKHADADSVDSSVASSVGEPSVQTPARGVDDDAEDDDAEGSDAGTPQLVNADVMNTPSSMNTPSEQGTPLTRPRSFLFGMVPVPVELPVPVSSPPTINEDCPYEEGDEAVVGYVSHSMTPTTAAIQRERERVPRDAGGAGGGAVHQGWFEEAKSGFSSASSDDGALFSARDMNDEETPYRVEPSRWTHAYSSHTTWEE